MIIAKQFGWRGIEPVHILVLIHFCLHFLNQMFNYIHTGAGVVTALFLPAYMLLLCYCQLFCNVFYKMFDILGTYYLFFHLDSCL